MPAFAGVTEGRRLCVTSLRARARRHHLLPVEIGAAAGDLFRREPFDIGIVELPGGIVAPGQGILHRGARREGALKQRECEAERLSWLARSWGRPAALPSGKSEKRKRGTPTYSTMSFAQPMTTVAMPAVSERARGEAHALMADRAIGDEQCGIDAVGARQRETSSGQSVSSVTRWLRLVGRP